MSTILRIALYKSTEYGSVSAMKESDDSWLTKGGWVRVSEFADVMFYDREPVEVLTEQLQALDRAADVIREKAADALGGIEQRRQELLALPAPVSP